MFDNQDGRPPAAAVEIWDRGNSTMTRTALKALVFTALVAAMGAALAQDAPPKMPSADGAKVYFIAPQDGATVSSPVLVQFGLTGMGVAPAGVEWENTGHHHLIVDADLPNLDDYLPPADDTYRHFGGGQTEAPIELEPGQHTLQLLFADQDHLPHDPPLYSQKITITVE